MAWSSHFRTVVHVIKRMTMKKGCNRKYHRQKIDNSRQKNWGSSKRPHWGGGLGCTGVVMLKQAPCFLSNVVARRVGKVGRGKRDDTRELKSTIKVV